MKFCSKCISEKSLDDFGNNKDANDGKQLWCKNCTNDYYSTWRKKNKEASGPQERKQFKKFYATVHGRAVHMLNNARARAKRSGIEFTLDVVWVENKLIDGMCEVTKIPFILQENGGKGHRINSFSPSIDRIDQIGAYTPDNCQMTCWIYNRAKGAFPLDDLHRMVSAMNQATSLA